MREINVNHYTRNINAELILLMVLIQSLISTSVVLAGIGIAFPILLPIQITAVVCGSLGGLVKLIRRKLTTKSKKHYEIKTMAECKLNSIKDLISKSLTDGQISENEF